MHCKFITGYILLLCLQCLSPTQMSESGNTVSPLTPSTASNCSLEENKLRESETDLIHSTEGKGSWLVERLRPSILLRAHVACSGWEGRDVKRPRTLLIVVWNTGRSTQPVAGWVCLLLWIKVDWISPKSCKKR